MSRERPYAGHGVDARSAEDGVALVYAMLATLIISGIAVVLVNLAMSELRLTAQSASWETAIHSAEGGADVVVTAVTDEPGYTTKDPDGAEHVYDPAGPSPAEVEAWAISEATSNCNLVATGDGEACGIRPVDSAGDPMDVVFGVGFVPSLADAQATRVVRVEYDRGFLSPTKALLTGGDLTISGSADILGEMGNVHTNGDLTISGMGAEISGDVTYSGDLNGDTTGKATEAPLENIDPVTANGVYKEQWSTFASDWYDLCPDGKVRRPSSDGPCDPNSEVLWDQETAAFHGWSYKATAGGTATWKTSGGAPDDGIYYVYHGNAELAGAGNSPTTTMSVLVEGVADDCGGTSDEGKHAGHFKLGANVTWRPFLADAMVIADGDISVSGTTNQDLEGVMMARQQIEVTGGPSLEGSLIAEDRCDHADSPVHDVVISGSMQLTHNGDLLVPVSGIVRVIAWNEL